MLAPPLRTPAQQTRRVQGSVDGTVTLGVVTVVLTVGVVIVILTVGTVTLGVVTLGTVTLGVVTLGVVTLGTVTVGTVTVGTVTVGTVTVGTVIVGVGTVTLGTVTLGTVDRRRGHGGGDRGGGDRGTGSSRLSATTPTTAPRPSGAGVRKPWGRCSKWSRRSRQSTVVMPARPDCGRARRRVAVGVDLTGDRGQCARRGGCAGSDGSTTLGRGGDPVTSPGSTLERSGNLFRNELGGERGQSHEPHCGQSDGLEPALGKRRHTS